MKQPNKNLLKLCSMSYIKSIEISYDQTGTDTADTFVTIKGISGVVAKGLWKTYEEYLNLRVDYNSIAVVHGRYLKEVAEWKAYEKENAEDILEFERLKEKLDK